MEHGLAGAYPIWNFVAPNGTNLPKKTYKEGRDFAPEKTKTAPNFACQSRASTANYRAISLKNHLKT
ncbi:MAG TPA: hypothetical protein VN667_15115 [Burkholderiales bacterium]|nr:hypothetical protein [Burkholderiales bacterium]